MFYGLCKRVLKKLKAILYSDTDKQQKYQEIQEMKDTILHKPFMKIGRSSVLHPW